MKLKWSLISFFLITASYLLGLIWVDSKNSVFSQLPFLWSSLVLMAGLSMLSYLLRFARWRWLLARSGNHTSVLKSFLAYLSGFAFTATPGKAGELIRIRYFSPLGVKPLRTLSAFIFERVFDLLVVLLLAALFVTRMDIFIIVFGFVFILLAIVAVMYLRPSIMISLVRPLRVMKIKGIEKLILTLHDGFVGCRCWVNPIDIFVSIFLGACAWLLTSLSFVYLLNQLDIDIPLLASISIYPIAMLAGASSMIPGGIGSTEATIIALVSAAGGASLEVAALAAIGIRLATLWFAIIAGFLSVIVLEIFDKRRKS